MGLEPVLSAPTATPAFRLTDSEGSTRLRAADPATVRPALTRGAILREAVRAHETSVDGRHSRGTEDVRRRLGLL